MRLSLEPVPAFRHHRFVTKDAPTTDTRKAIGRAIAFLRERAGLTQEQAGERAGMTAQYFGMHELGKVKGLTHPEVQQKLLRAVDATPEDLEAALNEISGDDTPAARIARMARELGSPAPAAGPAVRQAVFPTADGDVVITLPAHFTPAGFKQLEEYFAVFIRANAPGPTH